MTATRKKTDITLLLRTPLIHILFIAALGFLVYSNTFYSSFHWDDSPQISHNTVIKDIRNFTSNTKGYDFNPRRFAGYFSFALNYYLGGGSVTGYHIVNFVIHLINAFLVYFLVMLTFKTPYFSNQQSATGDRQAVPRNNPPLSPPKLRGDEGGLNFPDSRFTIHDQRPFIALFSALLFVSHPLQTEAVTYIVQRLASLATLFYLLSLVLYIKGRLEVGGRGSEGESVKSSHPIPHTKYVFYSLSLISAVLAMKTKEIAFTLPVIIVLYEFAFFKSSPKKKLLLLLPVVLTLLIIPLSVLHSGKPLGEILSDVTQQTRVQTSMSRWDYLMTQAGVITTYLRLIFFPVNQNLDYDYPLYHSLFAPRVFLSLLSLLAVFGLAVYLFYKSRQAGEPASRQEEEKESSLEDGGLMPEHGSPSLRPPTSNLYRLISFGIFWFFIALSVESSIIPIVDVIFEHRVYLPSVGLFIAITTGVFVVAGRFKKEKVLVAALVLVLALFSGITYARNSVWKNETSLWEDVVRKSPDKARPHSNLGYFYMGEGLLDKAHKELLAALRINPGYVEAHTSLGNVYFLQGKRDDALRELQTALKLNPGYTEAHIDLGNLYSAEGSLDKALGQYEAVLKRNPDHVEAHISLGNVYLMKGRKDEALREYKTALRLSPDDFQAHNNLGNLYFMQGRLDQAIEEYQTALKLNPGADRTRKNLMTAYRKQGRLDETAGKDRGTGVKPDTGPAQDHINLANIYYRQGRLDEAVKEYGDFLKLNPDSVEAHNNLGNIYYKQGLLDKALAEYRTALRLRPGSAEVHNNLGKIYGRQGRLDEALKEFQAAVSLIPDFADAHNMLGNVYGLQGDLEKALKEYETALKLDPGSADSHNNLGTIYYRQGRLDKALREFQTALRLEPDNRGARRNLEMLYKKKGTGR
ncbi:MAG: tetratricopeptide repeat protein [Candidatus Sulfobium sp.]